MPSQIVCPRVPPCFRHPCFKVSNCKKLPKKDMFVSLGSINKPIVPPLLLFLFIFMMRMLFKLFYYLWEINKDKKVHMFKATLVISSKAIHIVLKGIFWKNTTCSENVLFDTGLYRRYYIVLNV